MERFIFVHGEYTFKVYPEQVVFTRDNVFKVSQGEWETHEELLERLSRDIQRALEAKGCELLEVNFSESHELAYMRDCMKPEHKVRHKILTKKHKRENNRASH